MLPRIAWYSLRFPHYNNRRYAELIPRLQSVEATELRLHRNALLWRAEFHAYWRVGRRWLDPRVLQRLGARHPYLLGATDLRHIELFPGRTVFDVDDPVFTPDFLRAFDSRKLLALVTTTPQLREQLIAAGVNVPVHVIPQGVDLAALDPERTRALRARFTRPGDVVVGVSAPDLCRTAEVSRGRGQAMHDIEYAISAWDQLRRRVPHARLWLFGRPSEAVRAWAGARPDVRLFGFLPARDLLPHIAACDIALYPRTLDFNGRFSIKLLEYMACGVPVVSTAVGEAFMLREQGAGIVAAGLPAFVDGIEALATSPAERERLGERGRSYGSAHDWSAVAARYEREVLDVYCA